MQCRNCGTEIAEKALICYRCGTPTTEAKFKAPSVRRAPGRRRVVLSASLIAILLLLAIFIAYFLK
jgi:uncharacterized membrane protein YvbJ